MEDGIWAIQLNGIAIRNQWKEVIVCSASGWQNKSFTFFSFHTLLWEDQTHFSFHMFSTSLCCIDIIVVNLLYHLSTAEKLIQTHPIEVSEGQSLKTVVRQYCCYFGFDNHCGQASCFENKYQTFDMTFIFHNVSALQLLEWNLSETFISYDSFLFPERYPLIKC